MLDTQSLVNSFLLITSLQPKCFDELTHSFAQRRSAIPCIIKAFRTLSVVTGVVPPAATFNLAALPAGKIACLRHI